MVGIFLDLYHAQLNHLAGEKQRDTVLKQAVARNGRDFEFWTARAVEWSECGAADPRQVSMSCFALAERALFSHLSLKQDTACV